MRVHSAGQTSSDINGAIVIIPARMGSVRLPGKPLADIHGRPMVARVWERAAAAVGAERAWIATEDDEIGAMAAARGIPCVRTGRCENGTERVLEAAERLGWGGAVVNVQGDEPLIEPGLIRRVAEGCGGEGGGSGDRGGERGGSVWTACAPLLSGAESPARVKVARSGDRALYFSRQPIPTGGPWWLHLGVYGFGAAAAARVRGLRAVSALEISERLEQLRWMEAGIPIRLVETAAGEGGVDVAEDLERVRRMIGGG